MTKIPKVHDKTGARSYKKGGVAKNWLFYKEILSFTFIPLMSGMSGRFGPNNGKDQIFILLWDATFI